MKLAFRDTELPVDETQIDAAPQPNSASNPDGIGQPQSQIAPQFAGTVGVGPTGDINIDALIDGTVWSGSALTFNFPATPGYYGYDYSDVLEQTHNFSMAPLQVQNAVRNIFATEFPRYLNMTFTEVGPTVISDISIAFSDSPSPTAWAYGPDPALVGGDVWFSYNNDWYAAPVRGNYAWTTILHELGHSMGLTHGHQGGGFGTGPMNADRDSMEFSVMTYRSYIGGPDSGYTNEDFGYAQTLMMYDIAALQHMYGANYTTNSTNSLYTWSPTTGQMFINGAAQWAPGANRIFMTIWDGGGTDTYDLSNYTSNLTLDLAPGGWSTYSTEQLALLNFDGSEVARANVFNALLHAGDMRSIIENATGGGGNDTLAGNDANNVLSGNSGNDILRGLVGNDTLNGGFGDDTIEGGDGLDTLNGGYGNDTLNGGAGIDLLDGGEGFDNLIGGADADILRGGGGNDTLRFDEFDSVYLGGTGTDTGIVSTTTGMTVVLLAHELEAATGNTGNDVLDASGVTVAVTLNGGDGNDTLIGNSGADTLDGGGGDDTMTGGAGSDTYSVDSLADVTNELANGGTDTVRATIGWTLAANIENLILSGSAPLTGVGNDLANQITGSAGDNYLDGGLGNDTMTGGTGNDGYFLDSLLDVVVEAAGQGTDYVAVAVSGYTLAANIENGTVSLVTGARLIGNTGANSLLGNTGNDILEGGAGNDTLNGGLGMDRLLGGDGDDAIVWDAGDDLANILGGNGTDTLHFNGATPVTFDLAAHQIERAVGVVLDAGAELWNLITTTYTATWQQAIVRIDNDDISYSVATYDTTGSMGALNRYTDYFNPAAERTAQESYNDGIGGASYLGRTTVYYTSGVANYIDDFNTAGLRTSQEYFRVDGSRQTSTVWDATGSLGAIEFYQDNFDGAGNRTSQTVYYDGQGAGAGAGASIGAFTGVDYQTTIWTDATGLHGTQQGFDLADPTAALYTFVF